MVAGSVFRGNSETVALLVVDSGTAGGRQWHCWW